jgi:predicted NAD/FAD-dependent oxidoreductase
MAEINNPHDHGYKALLASEEVFLELLQSFIDMGWVSQIDPAAITRIDKSYKMKLLRFLNNQDPRRRNRWFPIWERHYEKCMRMPR